MTRAEELSFLRICHEELSRDKARRSIGLLEEKRLHSTLKRWICDDFSTHEQRIEGQDEKKRKCVADILTKDGRIYEIQTGKLYPLAAKLAFYIEKTEHPVTVVHPLIGKKHVNWLDPHTGEVSARNRSPLREGPLCAIAQLKPFLPYLESGRLSVLLPVIEAEEFRLLDGWSKNGKRGSHRYELLPTSLLEVYRLCAREEYLAALPQALPATFTAREFGKHAKLQRHAIYGALAVYEGLGIVEKCGMLGKAALYRRTM